MTEQPTITPEQVAEFHRLQQMAEQDAMQSCIVDLQRRAEQYGFIIVAIPQLTPDGRITAGWGLQRKQA